MKAQHQKTGSKRLLWAFGLLLVSAVLLFVVFDGHIFSFTRGAEAGLYATIATMFAGLVTAFSALVLAAQTLLGTSRHPSPASRGHGKTQERSTARQGKKAA